MRAFFCYRMAAVWVFLAEHRQLSLHDKQMQTYANTLSVFARFQKMVPCLFCPLPFKALAFVDVHFASFCSLKCKPQRFTIKMLPLIPNSPQNMQIQHVYSMYVYEVIDLKVLVRSFNCESRACYVGNPRESLFFSSSRK